MRFRCTEKIICAEPDDNPLTPFSSAGQDSPKALACEAIICAPSYSPITGSPVGDNPVMNLSSEEPDRDIFIGEIWGVDKPGLNKFWSLGCHGWCESVISQGDADACAERSWTECSRTYWNTPQICSYACAGGQFKVYTQPAHTFVADTQAKANSYAHQYACWMAYYIAMCGPGGPGGGGGGVPASPIPPAQPPAHPLYTNTEQSCTKTCNNGQPKTYTVPPGFMYGGSVAAANAAAQSYACQKATELVQTQCGFDVWNDEQTATVTCPDGTTQTATVAANTVGITLLSGGADDIAAAKQQMNAVALANAQADAQKKCVCLITSPATLPPTTNDATIYNYQLTCDTPDLPPRTWTIVAGSLPSGLALNASSGLISGVITDIGDFSFTVKLVAQHGTSPASCQKAFTLHVNPWPQFDFAWVFTQNPLYLNDSGSGSGATWQGQASFRGAANLTGSKAASSNFKARCIVSDVHVAGGNVRVQFNNGGSLSWIYQLPGTPSPQDFTIMMAGATYSVLVDWGATFGATDSVVFSGKLIYLGPP